MDVSYFFGALAVLARWVYLVATTIVVTASLLILLYWVARDRRLDKVPGPKGNPVTGIGLDLPPDAAQKLKEWSDQYGEVYKIRVGWWNWVVLNSPEAVKEVFDKQVLWFQRSLAVKLNAKFCIK